MGRGSGRPGGNPDFGRKYKTARKTTKELSEQVGTRVDLALKSKLKEVANKKNCSVPDLVRAAIEMYLLNEAETKKVVCSGFN